MGADQEDSVAPNSVPSQNGRWGDGALERWGDGALERWGVGAMEVWFCPSAPTPHCPRDAQQFLGRYVTMSSRISKLFMVCIVLVVISGVQQVSADEMEAGTWTRKADMPTKRSNLGSALVDGKIYVIGGTPFSGGAVASAEEYDPTTDIWTKRANMPTAREGIRAAAVDGIVYTIGGWKPGGDTSILEAYDPATDKWTRKANMPTRRTMTAVAVVDGIIYVIGGELGITPLSVVEAYDPATNKWTRMASMPTARYMAGYCVIDGLIYVFGGATRRNAEFMIWGSVPTVEVYDPATNTWAQSSDMPRPRHGHTISVVDGMIYVVGGIDSEVVGLFLEGKLEQDEAGKLFIIVDVYDPDTDMWTTAVDLPLSIGFHTAAVVNGKIYAIGGSTGPEGARLSEVYEFTPGLLHAGSSVSPAGKLLETWGQVKKVH